VPELRRPAGGRIDERRGGCVTRRHRYQRRWPQGDARRIRRQREGEPGKRAVVTAMRDSRRRTVRWRALGGSARARDVGALRLVRVVRLARAVPLMRLMRVMRLSRVVRVMGGMRLVR